jgi:hypothetical protein
MAGCLGGLARVSHPTLERLQAHTDEPAVRENWKLSAAHAGHHAGGATAPTAEPETINQGETHVGGDATSSGWGCQAESGRIGASGSPGTAVPPVLRNY